MFYLKLNILILPLSLWAEYEVGGEKQVILVYDINLFEKVVLSNLTLLPAEPPEKPSNLTHMSLLLLLLPFVVVQSLSHVQLFVTPWTEASPGVHQSSCPLNQ